MKTNEGKSNSVNLSFKMNKKTNLVPEDFYSIFKALYITPIYAAIQINYKSWY